MNVKNDTGHDCSLSVKGTYKKADGKRAGFEVKTFSGLSAGDDNYFIFNPGIPFATLTCEVTEINDGAAAFTGYITFETTARMHNTADELSFPPGIDDDYIQMLNWPVAGPRFEYTNAAPLWLKCDWLVFDNTGKVAWVGTYNGGNITGPSSNITCKIDRHCEKVNGHYVIPDNLKGDLNFIIAITYASDVKDSAN